VHQNREYQVSNVVEAIRRQMQRSEDLAAVADETASTSEARSVGASPSCVSHARFARCPLGSRKSRRRLQPIHFHCQPARTVP
jgi:hypothetical protein